MDSDNYLSDRNPPYNFSGAVESETRFKKKQKNINNSSHCISESSDRLFVSDHLPICRVSEHAAGLRGDVDHHGLALVHLDVRRAGAEEVHEGPRGAHPRHVGQGRHADRVLLLQRGAEVQYLECRMPRRRNANLQIARAGRMDFEEGRGPPPARPRGSAAEASPVPQYKRTASSTNVYFSTCLT